MIRSGRPVHGCSGRKLDGEFDHLSGCLRVPMKYSHALNSLSSKKEPERLQKVPSPTTRGLFSWWLLFLAAFIPLRKTSKGLKDRLLAFKVVYNFAYSGYKILILLRICQDNVVQPIHV